MLDPADEKAMAEIAAAVRDRESISETVIGSAIGGVVAATLFLTFAAAGPVPSVFLVLPSLPVAYFARFLGRPIRLWLRLIPGVVAGVIHLFGSLLLFPSPMVAGLIPVSCILASYLCKAKLTPEEEKALFREEMRN